MGAKPRALHLRWPETGAVKAPRIHPLVAALSLGFALMAQPVAVNAENGAKPPLDFELSDSRQFVKLSALPAQITVINFWRADCPPCVREIPLLARLADQKQIRIVTIALQRPAETAMAPSTVLEALNPPLIALHAPGEARGLLARFGNPSGALPHTVILNSERRPCAQQTGELTQSSLAAMLSNCAAP